MVENNEWIKLDKKKTINPNIKPFEYAERKDITEVNIPNGVTTIGERAFAKCTNLKKLIIPDSVTTIGASAFNECENLEEVVLSKNIKKLNYRTFADCKRLKKIIIPEGIKELDWAVFSGCENIEEIVLPSSIKTINKQLFLNCKKLKSIILPKNITYLPDECFRGCKNLDIILDENIIELGKIYEAFLRGANAFVVAYNQNHKSTPLHNISYLTDAKHPVVDVQQALQYGSYSLSGSGYSGDWTSKQRLVLKR